jgi:hypothetical protein
MDGWPSTVLRSRPAVHEPHRPRRAIIDTSVLDNWDAAIVERFDALRRSAWIERIDVSFVVSAECLTYLDRTLDEIRKRAQRRGAESAAVGVERVALRSAAVEVATGAYVEGFRRGRRHRAASDSRTTDLETRAAAQARSGVPMACGISPTLLADLDALLEELAGGDASAEGLAHRVSLNALRSVVVESSLSSWLILRGYSGIAPRPPADRGWLSVLRYLAWERRRRG